MVLYKIKFYVTPRGDCPFQIFLNAAQPKIQAKFIKILDLLAYEGPNLKRPYADVLKEGIRELRVKWGHNQYRGLYFFIMGNHIIVTHGILKNTGKVPPGEIDRAIRCRVDFEERLKRAEIML